MAAHPKSTAADLELNACAIVLAHNHPSGDATPSSVDVATTRQVAEAGRALRGFLQVYILAGDTLTSFRRLGLL